MRSALSLYATVLLGSSIALIGGAALAQAGGAAQSERAPRYIEGTDAGGGAQSQQVPRYIEGTDLPFTVDPSAVAQAKPAEAPASRDELFGLKPAPGAAPAPAAAPKPVSASGFYGATVAYTTSDPTHWSRAVNRFQFSLQGEGTGVKWKIGGRADVDPVYMSDSFYLPAVQKDQRNDFFWRETYLDFSAGGLDFRVGAQDIVWGDVVGFFVADVVSARDLREFLLPSFDIMRAPQWAVRAEYFKGDSHLELVWIPYPTYDNIGKPGSDFYPVRLPSPTSAGAAAPFQDPDVPARTLDNSNYGIRANTLVDGWDVGAFYYRSFSRTPTFYTLPGGVVQPRYDRIWQVGGTVNKDLGSAVLHFEGVYTGGQSYASTDPLAPQGVLQRDSFDWVVGTDLALPRDTRLNVQVFQRIYDGSADTLVIQAGDVGVSAQLAAKITSAWEPQILWIQTFGGGGGLIRPRVNWYPVKNTTLGFGVDIFTGPDNGFFGRYNNRDRVYGEVRYDF
jgi:hypothetical protein